MKLLDYNGLSHLIEKIKTYVTDNAKVTRLAMRQIDMFSSVDDAKAFVTRNFNGVFRYDLYDGTQNYLAGHLIIFSDNMCHQLTQVLISHYSINNLSGHDDTKITIQYRSYNINSPHLKNAVGTWTEWKEYPTHPDYEAQLPCEWTIQSIAADGTVVNPGTKRLPNLTDDASVALYNRLQKGLPPSVVVDMATSDGETRKVYCYLTKLQATGRTYTYESGVLANGTFSNKCIRVIIQVPTYSVTASCTDVTT